MIFPSQIFLFAFLPALLVVYYLTGRRYRNLVLLLFSYFFYIWGSGHFLFILIASTFIDYIFGLMIERSRNNQRRLWLTLSIFVNLLILGYFKYSNFFIQEVNNVLSSFDTSLVDWTAVILPIGISFFTFQKITYVVDVYRGTRKALNNIVDYALYVALFPQLIAGPIVRFHEISEQIKSRKETLECFYQGILRFSWGLMKKVLLANSCGEIADAVFSLNSGMLDTKTAWLGVFAYTFQIYFDFSAYSDMAIGLGRMFGFKLPENFKRPYSAISITDFWRRWHITLSNFFRDYLYIPLGGNRFGPVRTYFNLMMVFVLCGLWHGANWTFLVWGIFHGALLITERLSGIRLTEGVRFLLPRRVLTLLLVMIGWVFFRADTLGQALDMLSIMFVPVNFETYFYFAPVFNNRNLAFFILASTVVFFPRSFSGFTLFNTDRGQIVAMGQTLAIIVAVLYSTILIVSGSYNPFIYFQF